MIDTINIIRVVDKIGVSKYFACKSIGPRCNPAIMVKIPQIVFKSSIPYWF